MFFEAKVTEIYCSADDFCQEFAKYQEITCANSTNKCNEILNVSVFRNLMLYVWDKDDKDVSKKHGIV